MSKVLDIYNTCSRLPLGKWMFSKMVCLKAPYFHSIKPVYTRLEEGYGEVVMKNRRRVRNHINSVHAIAMCNMCEYVGGMVIECSIPSHLRWIPKEMRVEYLKVARTDLTASCRLEVADWQDAMEVPVVVEVFDTRKVMVLRATITMHVSRKKKR